MALNRRYIGDFSKASFRAMEYAEMLQGLALDHIKKTFQAEELGLDLDNMTLGEFMRAQLEAEEGGTREEFERMLATKLAPLLDQMMAQQQQQPQQQGGQQPPQGI